jgi:cystathionine beta-lyase
MWVADMDFPVAKPISDAVEKRAKHGIYAYTTIPDKWYDAYIGWWDSRHNLPLKKENLLFSNGVMPTISSIIRAFSDVDDKILIQTPVYHVFFFVIENNNRQVVENELIYEDDTYYIDYDDLDEKLKDVKIMLLCNPHNPVGRLWTKDELEMIGQLCKKHDVLLVSDEIHCDLVNPGLEYVPYFSLDQSLTDNAFMCMSPTKTFNIAGLQSSAAYATNISLFEGLKKQLLNDQYIMPNVFAIDSVIAAFNECAGWLDNLNEYIYENKMIVSKFINEELSMLRYVTSEATYLLWIDCNDIDCDYDEFYEKLRYQYGLYISPGIQFGKCGDGFIRINIACPKSLVIEGLNILKEAINDINK